MQNLPDFRFTQEGYDNLKKELQGLLQERPGVLTRMVAAREQGDLSENAGYHAAKDRLGEIDSRIRDLKLLIRLGKVIQASGENTVSFGSTVTINDGQKESQFTIVSAHEADPLKGKISQDSPIGKVLLGKNAGDSVEIEVPDGKVNYNIVNIKNTKARNH